MPGRNLCDYVDGRPLDTTDPIGQWTIQLGATGGGTAGSFSLLGFGGTALDDQGNVAPYNGYGFGKSTSPVLGTGLGLRLSISNAKNVCDLSGPFLTVSGGGGDGDNVSADEFFGPSNDGQVADGGLSTGAGLGTSSFVGITNTNVTPIDNLFQ